MKTSSLVGAILVLTILGPHAQVANTPANASPSSPVPAATSPQVVEIGPHHRIWQWETYEQSPRRKNIPHITPRIHRVTELAGGMHYQNANGQWVDSQEEVVSYLGGAVAQQGQYQVIFANNLNSAGSIDMQTPDGKRLRSNILGLMYVDTATGNSVMIAQLQDSIGTLISTNQVLYTNAFQGVNADVCYTYKRARFEQDVILRTQLPTPESFGLNSDTTLLEVVTEFIDPPAPVITQIIGTTDDQTDDTVSWGSTTISHGKAFDLSGKQNPSLAVMVNKRFVNIQGRFFLVEKVRMTSIQSQLNSLPTQASIRVSLPVMASKQLQFPKTPLARVDKNPMMKLAKATPMNSGYVLDYVTINSSGTNFTFKGDATYYVSGEYSLSGTTTIEGGAVIKMDGSGQLDIDPSGSVMCQTAPYRPGVFTSINDTNVGEAFGSGTPAFDDVDTFLFFNQTNASVHDLRFSYCLLGINQAWGYGPSWLSVRDCQFLNGGIAVYGYAVGLYNVLIGRSTNVNNAAVFVEGPGLVLDAENVTADYGGGLVEIDHRRMTIAMTNCLITRQPLISNMGFTMTLLTNSTVCLPSPTVPVYQTVGAGNYYLTNGSPYHTNGSTVIDPVLVASLASKTTYPPILYSNITFFSNLTLSPLTPRDTNAAPDLGYHYNPMDYLCGGVCVSNANVTINPGTVVGTFELNINSGLPYGVGFDVEGGGELNSQGTATIPIRIVGYNTVQEGLPGPNWGSPASQPDLLSDYFLNSPTGTVLNFRFTDFSCVAKDCYLWDIENTSTVLFRDSEFYGGANWCDSINITNCLFDRVDSNFFPPGSLHSMFCNNNVYGGEFFFIPQPLDGGVTNLTVYNNLFDLPDISLSGSNANYAINGYGNDSKCNAWYVPIVIYTNIALPNHYFPNGFMLTNEIAYQTGPLGTFYQPPDSPLINAGNTNASLLGLYHYTVTTNEVVDGTNTVSIGYHYVATDAYGNPLDAYWFGIPDYLADNNGSLGAWEMRWFGHLGVDPNADPDADGLSNLQEFEAGSNPLSTTQVLAWGNNSSGECNVPDGLTNAIAVAGNGNGYPMTTAYSIALKSDGGLIAWGDNSLGQTNIPSGVNDGIAIAAGNCHALVLHSNGTVSVWGSWIYGTTNYPAVTPVGLTNVIAIAAAANHDLAVRSDGSVIAWGYDTNRLAVQVPSNLPPAKAVAAGWYYSAALLTNNTVVSWGSEPIQIPTNLTNVIAISGALDDIIALCADGTAVDLTSEPPYYFPDASNLVAVSDGYMPGLGLNGAASVVILEDSIPAPDYPLNNIEAIAAGWEHGIAVRSGLLTPFIIGQPASQIIAQGKNVSLSVQSLSFAKTAYQWQFQSVNIPQATNITLVLSNVQASASGNYCCLVANPAGSILSSNALLTVVPPPVILAQSLPAVTNVIFQSNLTLIVQIPTNSYGYNFVWKYNGSVIAGANTNSLTLSNLYPSAAGSYAVYISNLAGTTNSNWQVNVIHPGGILIFQQPTDQYQLTGSNVTFAVGAVGTGLTTYQWQFGGTNIAGATNASLTLTNVQTAQGGAYSVVVTDDSGTGSVISSNANLYLVTPPVITYQSQPANIICIYGNNVAFAATASALGQFNGFPLSYQWQFSGTNISAATSNSYAFNATDTSTGNYSLVVANAAGNASVSWQVTVTNTINVTNDLLLIYNTNSADSTTVLNYYLAHRPGVGGANVLGLNCTNSETVSPNYFTNVFIPQVQAWLTNNPTKRPQYVILFYDVPSRVNTNSAAGIYPEVNWPSVQYQLYSGCVAGWNPFVTSINMASTNDCIGYINKLVTIGTLISNNSPTLSASAGNYGNINYVIDDVNNAYCGDVWVPATTNGLIAAGVPTTNILFLTGCETATNLPHLTNAVNVAGYITWGTYTSLGNDYPINGKVKWTGNSGWWIMRSEESFNGQRQAFGQGNFVKWFASNSFGGTNYLNAPIGGVTYTDEPGAAGTDNAKYFSLWATGKNFAICAWGSVNLGGYIPPYQMVGDPFVTK